MSSRRKLLPHTRLLTLSIIFSLVTPNLGFSQELVAPETPTRSQRTPVPLKPTPVAERQNPTYRQEETSAWQEAEKSQLHYNDLWKLISPDEEQSVSSLKEAVSLRPLVDTRTRELLERNHLAGPNFWDGMHALLASAVNRFGLAGFAALKPELYVFSLKEPTQPAIKSASYSERLEYILGNPIYGMAFIYNRIPGVESSSTTHGITLFVDGNDRLTNIIDSVLGNNIVPLDNIVTQTGHVSVSMDRVYATKSILGLSAEIGENIKRRLKLSFNEENNSCENLIFYVNAIISLQDANLINNILFGFPLLGHSAAEWVLGDYRCRSDFFEIIDTYYFARILTSETMKLLFDQTVHALWQSWGVVDYDFDDERGKWTRHTSGDEALDDIAFGASIIVRDLMTYLDEDDFDSQSESTSLYDDYRLVRNLMEQRLLNFLYGAVNPPPFSKLAGSAAESFLKDLAKLSPQHAAKVVVHLFLSTDLNSSHERLRLIEYFFYTNETLDDLLAKDGFYQALIHEISLSQSYGKPLIQHELRSESFETLYNQRFSSPGHGLEIFTALLRFEKRIADNAGYHALNSLETLAFRLGEDWILYREGGRDFLLRLANSSSVRSPDYFDGHKGGPVPYGPY